ncbi:MAG: DUF3568 family protein [Planctomycetes bacterium]|nr:DUF3568 family protein [Planctomycetota bacterium]
MIETRRHIRSIALASLLLASTTILSGCLVVAAAGAGAGTYAYVTGELSSVEQANVDKVWKATQEAVKELQFTVKEQSKDALQGRLVAEQADKTDITIKVERETDTLTKVRIRVGVFGDEATSRLIMDKIKSNI